jgi:hypothetical protein
MDNDTQNAIDFDSGHQQRLMGVFGFNKADLEANRAGTIMPRQFQALREQLTIAVILIVVLPLGALVLAILQATGAFGASDKTFWYTVTWIGLGVLYVALNFTNVQRLSNAVRQPVVYSVEGLTRLEHTYSRTKSLFNPYRYYVNVKFVRLEVPRDQYDALEHGASYRIFYLGDVLTILSVEYLPGRHAETREASTGEGFTRYGSRGEETAR